MPHTHPIVLNNEFDELITDEPDYYHDRPWPDQEEKEDETVELEDVVDMFNRVFKEEK